MGSNPPSKRASSDSLKDETEKARRPPLPHQPTSATVINQESRQGNEVPGDSDSLLLDVLLLISTFIMMTWPWIFFGVMWAKDGIRMNNRLAQIVMNNPHTTTYLITLISTTISLIIGALFSAAVVRYAKEWVANKTEVKVFHVMAISAFKSHSWAWDFKLKNMLNLLQKRRWIPALLVLLCIAGFTNVTSSINSLLTPAPFTRNATLTGHELDFSSDAPECAPFFSASNFSNNCDWTGYKGLNYTTCIGENQVVDILESGRGNILSLISDNSQSVSFSQLGNPDGLHFLGPIHGILPIGPNGVPAFDTLENSTFSDLLSKKAVLSYNYTLDDQGLRSNITCVYENLSPIGVQALVPNLPVIQYTAACDGSSQVLKNTPSFRSAYSNNTLTYWACQSPNPSTDGPLYTVYLRGLNFYEQAIGNITCDILPAKTGVFPATFTSLPGIFSLAEPISSAPLAFSDLMELALVALGGVISEGQNFESNEVAESVITFGVKSFFQQPYVQSTTYLRLYEAMIQGILDYAATYIRLIYSANPDSSPPVPSSCIRAVNGTVSYQLFGWSVQPAHIGFLMATTLVNLSSFLILIAAMVASRNGVQKYDPTDPVTLMYDANVVVEGKGADAKNVWVDKVGFGTGKVGDKKIEGQQVEAEAEDKDKNRESVSSSIAKSG